MEINCDLFELFSNITPQKSNIDTKNCHVLKGPVTFSKAHHFGALQPLVFGSVPQQWKNILQETNISNISQLGSLGKSSTQKVPW